METIITFLLVVFVLYLWAEVRSLSQRLRVDEAAREHLEYKVDYLREATAGERGPAPELTAAPAPAPAVPQPAAPAVAPAMASAPAAVASPTVTLGPVVQPLAAGVASIAAAPAPEPAAAPVVAPKPEPAPGPSSSTRILARLGLSPSKEGELPTRATVEAWLEGRMLAVVGGIALTLGAVFFLSLAFSRGWITEPMRVLIGLGGGAAAIALGELAFLRVKGILGHVLLAVGLAVVSLSLFAATRLYGLIPAELGVAGALLASIVAAAIAIRHDSELIAAFGLITVLAAPPLLGAEATTVTVLFLATALVGTTAIALFRTWIWLPPLAFLLASPQVASSALNGESVPVAVLVILGFWLLNTIASAGEEIRHPTGQLRPTTISLLLANTAFTLWAGMAVLDGSYAAWRGAFVTAIAVAQLGMAVGLFARNGDRHPFGLIMAATGVAALAMAAPIQLGASWVPVAWAAEAVGLTWVAVRGRHPYAAGAALVVGSLSLLDLVLSIYPPDLLGTGFERTWPFFGAEGLTFAFLLGALIVAGVIVRVDWIRAALAVVGILTLTYVLPFETSGPVLVTAWAALTVASMAAWIRVVSPRLPPEFAERNVAALGLPAWLHAIEEGIADVSRGDSAGLCLDGADSDRRGDRASGRRRLPDHERGADARRHSVHRDRGVVGGCRRGRAGSGWLARPHARSAWGASASRCSSSSTRSGSRCRCRSSWSHGAPRRSPPC